MKLADYLVERQINHRAFAAQIGVSQAAVTRYVNGDRIPNRQTMRAIVTATDGRVTPNDFLAAAHAPPAPPFPISGDAA